MFRNILDNTQSANVRKKNKDEFVLDSTYQIIKYYAIITAIQADDHEGNRTLSKELSKNNPSSKIVLIERATYTSCWQVSIFK